MKGQKPGPALAEQHRHVGVRGTVLVPPAHLSDRAREVFVQAAEDVAAIGPILQPSDGPLLAIYSEYVAQAEAGFEQLATMSPEPTPERKRVTVATKDAVEKALTISDRYGLTPVSRTKFGVQRLEGATLLQRLDHDAHTVLDAEPPADVPF